MKKSDKKTEPSSLWTLCIEAIGDTLHRYESFEGIPIQIKTEIGNYLTRLGVFSQVPKYTRGDNFC